jgi:inhibitor of cysteine peptidase
LRRIFLLVVAVCGALGALNAASFGAEGVDRRMKPGEAFSISYDENPSTGYSWRIDASASAGLDCISIADGGHAPGASRPGAPGTHLWTVRALKPGRAAIQFVYQRPWEPAPIETRRVEVHVATSP